MRGGEEQLVRFIFFGQRGIESASRAVRVAKNGNFKSLTVIL